MNFLNKFKKNESSVIKRTVYGLVFVVFASALIGVSVAQEINHPDVLSIATTAQE